MTEKKSTAKKQTRKVPMLATHWEDGTPKSLNNAFTAHLRGSVSSVLKDNDVKRTNIQTEVMLRRREATPASKVFSVFSRAISSKEQT